MNIERELIISVLKLTKSGPISFQVLSKDAKIPLVVAQNLVKKMKKNGLVYLRNKIIEIDSLRRLQLAVHAVQLGADFERVAVSLTGKSSRTLRSSLLNGTTIL